MLAAGGSVADLLSERPLAERGRIGKDDAVTRELKLALLIGFSAVLVVAVLISDHFNQYKKPRIAPVSGDVASSGQFGVENTSNTGPNLVPDKVLMPNMVPPPKIEVVRGPADGGMVNPPGSGLKLSPGSDGSKTSPVQFIDPPAPAKTDKEYTIASGDTFYQLAKRFYNDGSLADKLCEYNKDKAGKASSLKIGQKIAIPDKDVLTGKAPAAPKGGLTPNLAPSTDSLKKMLENPPAEAMATTKNYTVRDGDTLTRIASSNGVSLNDLLDSNPTLKAKPDTLTVGMAIKLPSSR